MAERRAHEPDLTDVRPIVGTLLLTLVLVLVSGWLMWHAYLFWRQEPSPPVFAPQPQAPGGVQLQQNPRADMREYRARTQRRLHSYGWVDRDAGVVHIPIEHAMELLVERGLPRQQEKKSQGPGAGCNSLQRITPSTAKPRNIGKSPQRKILDHVAFTQNIGAALPRKLVFRNLRGDAVELASLAAQRPLILLLTWFDCPHLCPTLLDQLARTTAALPFAEDEYRVALVSIDPRATPASAAALARRLRERHGRITDDWAVLTGKEESIKTLARRIGFHYRYDAERNSYAHPAGLMVVAPGGTVSHYLLRIDARQPDLRLALVDAGRGQLGSPVDQLLLRCYHFDPHSGRYSFAVIRVLQIAGGLFVLALAALLFGLRRRERS